MWLLVLTLVLVPSLVLNLILVNYVARPGRLVLKTARWVLTLDLLVLGLVSLPILRDGLNESGRHDFRIVAASLWTLQFATSILALRDPRLLTLAVLVVFWLVALPETRLLLEAGLRRRSWISKTDRPFWWIENVPKSIVAVDVLVAAKAWLLGTSPSLFRLLGDAGNAVRGTITKNLRSFPLHTVIGTLKDITRTIIQNILDTRKGVSYKNT
ncbi:hypothetical protein E8E14_014108 [Neopestalotiopsis sp. 37M]|nr:hypothetical protein E8E14_014108 [Neopestalotiopsis sp. 37M]